MANNSNENFFGNFARNPLATSVTANLLGGSGFKAKKGGAAKFAAGLARQIADDRTISDETRNELRKGFEDPNLLFGGRAKALEARFNQARSGKGIFKSRQVLQEQRNIQKDRPGRRQTLLGSFSNRSSGGSIAGGNGT